MLTTLELKAMEEASFGGGVAVGVQTSLRGGGAGAGEPRFLTCFSLSRVSSRFALMLSSSLFSCCTLALDWADLCRASCSVDSRSLFIPASATEVLCLLFASLLTACSKSSIVLPCSSVLTCRRMTTASGFRIASHHRHVYLTSCHYSTWGPCQSEKVETKFHLECKLRSYFPQFRLRRMH